VLLKKGLKRNILLFLAVLDDIYGEFSYNEYLKKVRWGEGYEKKSTFQTVYRMAKVGEIEKKVEKGEPVLKITARGTKLLNETIRWRWFANRRWDQFWRMVIFDIPEKMRYRRDGLRKKLDSLGFGMWQRSVYITPHDVLREVRDYLETKRLYPECVCILARRHDFGDDRALASKVFNLVDLNVEYLKLAHEFDNLQIEIKKGEESRENLISYYNLLWEVYQTVLLNDPYLPKELLLDDWNAEEAREEFKKLTRLVWKL
jgi:phenylacetic acid degradation operon negative regulatory protein